MTNEEIEKMIHEHPEKFVMMKGICHDDLKSILDMVMPSSFWDNFEIVNKD